LRRVTDWTSSAIRCAKSNGLKLFRRLRDIKQRMARHQLNPRICNIALDANALDRDRTARDELVDRMATLIATRELNIVMAGGVRTEVQHPNTPQHVQKTVLPQIFNLRAGLNSGQSQDRAQVANILRGKAGATRHAADASHLSEAAETGCAFFITEDKRILSKRADLYAALPRTLMIVTLTEFFAIYDATSH
jgi:hypothetical protein